MTLPLFVLGLLISVLIATFGANMQSGLKIATDKAQVDESYRLLANVSESARAEILASLATRGIGPTALIDIIDCASHSSGCDHLPIYGYSSLPAWAKQLANFHDPFGLPNSRTQIAFSVATDASGIQKLVVKTKSEINGAVDRTIQIGFGSTNPFSNAISNSTFANGLLHIAVFGDVLQYGPFDNVTSTSSVIYGSWRSSLAANSGANILMKTPSNSGPLPLANYPSADIPVAAHMKSISASGSDDAYAHDLFVVASEPSYHGRQMTVHRTRQEQSPPKMNPDVARNFAKGTLTSSLMVKIPAGQTYSGNTFGPGTINGTFSGNIILNGRDNKPITITGRIFIDGDVIIFGKVSGQGEIIASKTIYIADDLLYNNPPPIFNGSSANLTALADRSRTAANAVNSASYDRLSLQAGNNVFIGDPFAGLTNKLSIPTELRLLQLNQLSKYDKKIGIDRDTGIVLDIETRGSLSCFVKPWLSLSDCISTNDPTIAIPPFAQYEDTSDASIISDRDYYLDSSGLKASPLFISLFYPQQYISRAPALWISSADYNSVTRNPAQYSAAATLDIYGGHSQMLYAEVPLPTLQTYDPSTLTQASMENVFETEFGLVTALSNSALKITNGEPYPTSGAQRFKDWVALTLKTVNGDGSSNYPYTDLKNFSRYQQGYSSNVSEMERGTLDGGGSQPSPYPYRMKGAVSRLNMYTGPQTLYKLNPTNPVPNGTTTGASYGYTQRVSINKDYHHWFRTVCDDYGNSKGYAAASPDIASCNQPSNVNFYKVPASDQAGPSVAIEFNFYPCKDNPIDCSASMVIATRFWELSKIRFRNRIHRIDASIFANQFLTVITGTLADRQLRINGGVTAREIFGQFQNNFGFDHTDLVNFPPNIHPPTQSVPSLWVTLDPRFQFTTDIITSDLVRIEMVR